MLQRSHSESYWERSFVQRRNIEFESFLSVCESLEGVRGRPLLWGGAHFLHFRAWLRKMPVLLQNAWELDV